MSLAVLAPFYRCSSIRLEEVTVSTQSHTARMRQKGGLNLVFQFSRSGQSQKDSLWQGWPQKVTFCSQSFPEAQTAGGICHGLAQNNSNEEAATLKHRETRPHTLVCEWRHLAGTVETKVASVSTFILGPRRLQSILGDERAPRLCGALSLPISHHPGPRTAKGPIPCSVHWGRHCLPCTVPLLKT